MAPKSASIDLEESSAVSIVAITATNGQLDLSHGTSEGNGAIGMSRKVNGHDDDPLAFLQPFHVVPDDRELNGQGPGRPSLAPVGNAPTAPSGSRGFVVGLALSTVLQMLQLERATCVLVVQAGKKTASIAIDTGEIVDATYNSYKGEEAIFEVLQWNDVQVEFRDPLPVERRIVVPLPHLLMESVRRIDEGTTQLLSERVLPESEHPSPGRPSDLNTPPPLDQEQMNDLATQEGVLALAVIDAQAMQAWTTDARSFSLSDEAIRAVSDFVLANLKVQKNISRSETVDDILVTTTDHYHVVRLLRPTMPLFLYLILDRQRANIALVRRRVSKIQIPSAQ